MTYVWFVIGVVLTLAGASWLVDGASGIAKKYGVSEFIIGVAIVGIGTSMPELTVSSLGALRGSAGIALGNVTGSNLFNTLFILGVTALINPIEFTRGNLRKDMHLNTLASVILLLFAFLPIAFVQSEGYQISRLEGLIFLLLFIGYIVMTFAAGSNPEDVQIEDEPDKQAKPLWLLIMLVVAGIVSLAVGGKLFVDKGCEIARLLKVSETVIAITFMACGTSLPELVTCIVAAARKRNQLALGNILGSNVSNILLILGCSALIRPLDVDAVNFFGFYAMIATAVLLYVSALIPRKGVLNRYKGLIFIALYALYIYATVIA